MMNEEKLLPVTSINKLPAPTNMVSLTIRNMLQYAPVNQHATQIDVDVENI